MIAFSSYSPGKGFAVLDALTRRCALDHEFGADGAATITIPSSLRPAHPEATGPEGLVIDVVAARNGGGAIVAGSYRGGWVVGEVTSRGRLDPTFARGGWSVLPFEGGVTAVLQEPSGRIIIAGNQHASGCCTVNWAAALSARGRLEHAFGRAGRVELPTGESSGIERMAFEPNGDILVKVGHGNMGCWGTSLAMLTPSGQPVPLFAERLSQFWQGLGLHAFVGDVYVEGEGFTLAGTGQKPCYDEPPGSKAPATGLLARFRPDGELDGPTIRFPSRMYGTVNAFRDGGDTLLVEYPYSETGQVTVTARRANGALDPRFGSLGRVEIHIPERSREARATLEILKAAPGEISLVATLSEYSEPPPEAPEVKLIRLRL
ncbi:MAG TPA: hypothetical protein VMF09_09465 [Solirubrobacteraceae bacterium]|nr:hypothetical protein [Solirubrobacteraceae bacterium]